MDYILKQLQRKIDYYEAANKVRDMADLYRVKVEYGLIFLLAYLWGQNFDMLDSESKEYIFGKIRQPSIGSILDVARKLDVNKEIFNNKKINWSPDSLVTANIKTARMFANVTRSAQLGASQSERDSSHGGLCDRQDDANQLE